MRDTWNDVAKYVKKKAKTNLDDKIAKVRKERKAMMTEDQPEENDKEESEDSDDNSSEEELSEDELVEDAVKTKEGDAKRKQRKRKKTLRLLRLELIYRLRETLMKKMNTLTRLRHMMTLQASTP